MRNLSVSFAAGVFALLLTSLGCRTHYEVYEVNPVDEPVPLFKAWLKGQFDEKEKQCVGVRLRYFANPTKKNDGRHRRLWHLTWYEIKDGEQEPQRKVVFDNQFGTQTVIIGSARYLMVPAAKKGTNDAIPNLNHYKCYEVLKWEGRKQEVRLQDQFDGQAHPAVVGKCVLFCVPVSKRVPERQLEDIWQPTWYLAVYAIETDTGAHKATVLDQFHQNVTDLLMRGPVLLSVPTAELDWKTIG